MDDRFFDAYWDRSAQHALKWETIPIPDAFIDRGFTPLPMWVADMDFATAPGVTKAVRQRTEHPLFGYFSLPDRYYEAISRWHRQRYGVQGLQKQDITYENGVLGGISSVVQICTRAGEGVLLNSPAYVGFSGILKNMGREIVLSPLQKDKDGIYRLDFEDMAEKIQKHNLRCAIFCSPHNPTGRVWEEDEITAYISLMNSLGVTVISDEIWADLILERGKRHIPTQSVSETARAITAAFYSPSKTFNLAGLPGAYSVIYNTSLKEKVQRFSSLGHYNTPNALSCAALWGGYEEGAEWVDELCRYVDSNHRYAMEYAAKRLAGFTFNRSEGTYLMLGDLSVWCRTHREEPDAVLRRMVHCGILPNDGRPFFAPGQVRMNFACPFARVEEAMYRLETYVFAE